MLITSPSGDFIELRITAYQYGTSPTAPAGGWDENWLTVAGRVKHGEKSWTFHEPCLTTWEAQELLAWLRHAGQHSPGEIEFTEPNLSFAARSDAGGAATIVVTLKGEAAPPDISDADRWGAGREISFRVSAAALVAAAEAWERDLTKFPVR